MHEPQCPRAGQPCVYEYAEHIRLQLARHPEIDFSSLSCFTCHEARGKLAILIAQSWVRQDINTAWNAVTRSLLRAIEKQLMFNELWG